LHESVLFPMLQGVVLFQMIADVGDFLRSFWRAVVPDFDLFSCTSSILCVTAEEIVSFTICCAAMLRVLLPRVRFSREWLVLTVLERFGAGGCVTTVRAGDSVDMYMLLFCTVMYVHPLPTSIKYFTLNIFVRAPLQAPCKNQRKKVCSRPIFRRDPVLGCNHTTSTTR